MQNAYQEEGLFCHGGLNVGARGVSVKELGSGDVPEEASVGVLNSSSGVGPLGDAVGVFAV